MTIQEIQQQVADDFSLFTEWLDKYAYLIELGKSLPPYDEKNKVEQNLIQGCQSRVWLNAKLEDGKVIFTADSDAIITKGIVSLLIRVFSGQTPQDIIAANTEFIDRIGLRENLSPTRANGLLSMVKQLKLYAVAFSAKASCGSAWQA
ncbi:MAG: SufE family protein [Prevotellaceae bacterium]|jgi:cysteine desulfuration protein SufE|nr:SufE family protein [Prevotellaceae bacterium]